MALTSDQLERIDKEDRKHKKLIEKDKNARFYFIVDETNLPTGTVCIMLEGGHFARGIALCSLKTSFPHPVEGSFLAWKNAKRALNRGMDDHLIMRPEALEVIHGFKSTLWNHAWGYRCQFDVLPDNGMEKRLFKELENGAKKGGTQGKGEVG